MITWNNISIYYSPEYKQIVHYCTKKMLVTFHEQKRILQLKTKTWVKYITH